MTRLTSLGITAALVTLVALPNHASAQTAYDNGSYIGGTNAVSISGLATADDFTVTSTITFNAIQFYAVDLSPGLLPSFSGQLTWFLYSGSAGSPSPNAIPSTNIIAQGTASNFTITDTGDIAAGDPNREIAQVYFRVPKQILSPGTYWLRLKEGTADSVFDGTPIYWRQTGGAIKGNGFRSDGNEVNPTTWDSAGTNTTNDLSFTLGMAPEPGTLALGALGLPLALLALQRRRNA
ncbi:hypothetical protein [Armatimonas rosea]|uniref:PEP-CTERM protein-sorting domain-containing protein n=1 Tax=Armatimonas rosea TaxID=685828 RepID=A0A7W9SRT9_ARMRO|nr:hypothetical protein [Armatimonas rosea]MBB6050819.1 hypothetical protein [Armatimonas rosea]